MIFSFLDSIWNPYDDPHVLSGSMGHFPMGSSAQQIRHFGQLVKNSEFRYFDYGKSKNIEQYGQSKPPLVDIREITEVPVAMFVGRQDSLANVVDNRWVKDQLGTLVYYEEIDASHGSFVIGRDMSFFDRVVELIQVHNSVDLTSQR